MDENQYHHNRNYGCRQTEIVLRGYRALVLENEKLRTTILLDKGTDIYELLYKPADVDFMWRSPLALDGRNRNPVTKELASGSVMDNYEGGWQELLPSISTPTNYKGMGLGFHGEAAFLPWECRVMEDTPACVRVELSVRMRRAPLLVKKTVTIRSQSSVLEFEETVTNAGDEEFAFMWGHHPAIGHPFLDENCVIDLPEGAIGQSYQVDFSGNSPFEPGREFSWPFATDRSGVAVDLSKVMSPEKKIAFNTYIRNLKEGWYGITNLKKGLGFGMQWDVAVFRYLLLWSVYRGFYGFPFYGRTYNLALELYSAIPDSLDEVIKLGRALTLQPGKQVSTRFCAVIYESGGRIAGFADNHQPVPRDK
ncbi:MAG: DUF4432 family protein [Spirochaetia bacterium]|jgi:hypothetical protein